MSWEKRGNTYCYYYRTITSQGKRTRMYYGRGKEARLASLKDQERSQERLQARQERQAWDYLESQIVALGRLTTLLSQSLLVDFEFTLHTHSREALLCISSCLQIQKCYSNIESL